MYLLLTFCPHSLGKLIDWKLVERKEVHIDSQSPLAGEANRLETFPIYRLDRLPLFAKTSRSPLAGEANRLETRISVRLALRSAKSPLAGEANRLETLLTR